MNAYISDGIAREHTDRLLADAAAARRARTARKARRGASADRSGARTADSSGRSSRTRVAAAAHAVGRPFAAIRAWALAAAL